VGDFLSERFARAMWAMATESTVSAVVALSCLLRDRISVSAGVKAGERSDPTRRNKCTHKNSSSPTLLRILKQTHSGRYRLLPYSYLRVQNPYSKKKPCASFRCRSWVIYPPFRKNDRFHTHHQAHNHLLLEPSLIGQILLTVNRSNDFDKLSL
jgi:hypothetical protein